MQIFRKLYAAQSAVYEQNPQAATSLLGVGESSHDATLNPKELAAWTMIANVMLNLDETVTKG
jgi:hypothetical protein